MPTEVTVWVYMLRHKPDDNCDGDPVSLHATRESAEAEVEKYTVSTNLIIEQWPVIP